MSSSCLVELAEGFHILHPTVEQVQSQARAAAGQRQLNENFDADLFLLSLDGGGVRGLSSLMILKKLMESIDPDDPPKPCDYFDMIGGTSTGGLIALLLGRLRLTVDDAIVAYKKLSPDIFTHVHHRVSVKGRIQGRFDHTALEKGVQALLRDHDVNPGELLKEPSKQIACKTYVKFSIYCVGCTVSNYVQIRLRN